MSAPKLNPYLQPVTSVGDHGFYNKKQLAAAFMEKLSEAFELFIELNESNTRSIIEDEFAKRNQADEPLYSPKELAAKFKVSMSTINRYLGHPGIKKYGLGQRGKQYKISELLSCHTKLSKLLPPIIS